ncbi:phage shock protein PspA [Dongshaea marina]|uniref:phage shock protein PspA n=1 Tax=Dongshaea marina TaxID=2047966 RepID=UPI000D3E75F3|nr:phage shock protein PspA [Dongshaea marina]
MGIFSRLADIVNSNISALLDKAEDPQKLIRLIIQEMEEQLVQERSNLARFLANRKSIERRIEGLGAQILEWQAKAELAINHGKEDLAHAALVEKQKQQSLLESVEHELELVIESVDQLGEAIALLQEKLKDARERQKALVLRHQAASSRVKVQQQVEKGTSQRVLDKFEMMEQKIERMEAQAEAYSATSSELEQEFEKLQSDDKVKEELEALKKKLGRDSKSKK